MPKQVHVGMVVQVLPDPTENVDDIAIELMDALKSVSMEYGLIFHADLQVVAEGEEGFVKSADSSSLVQVA